MKQWSIFLEMLCTFYVNSILFCPGLSRSFRSVLYTFSILHAGGPVPEGCSELDRLSSPPHPFKMACSRVQMSASFSFLLTH